MTIRRRCLSCGYSNHITLEHAEHDFGPRPDGAVEATSDMCPHCYPRQLIYPCGWVRPAAPSQEGR